MFPINLSIFHFFSFFFWGAGVLIFNASSWFERSLIHTDSSKDDVTTELVTPPALMFARTGAPKPIEESCRLVRMIDTFIADSFEKKSW